MSARRATDVIAVVLALIACVSLLGGLFDVAIRPPPQGVFAPPPPETRAERDAELTVRVVSAGSRQPLPGARIQVFHELGGRYYAAGTAVTDAAGRAVLRQLPRGVAFVVVDGDGHARSSTQLVLEGEPRSADVALGVAHALRVTVHDEKGQALPRATVLVESGDPLPFGALTGLDGTARFGRLGASPWSVKASARGYETVTRSGVAADTVIELRRLGSLEVHVVAAGGAPVASADVVITGSALWPARRATTDAHGVTRIAALLAGTYDLKAQKDDQVSDTLVGLPLERGEDKSVTLELHAGRMVTAVVTDGDGDSPVLVPGADVVLAESGLSSFPLRGRTGADGSVTLGPLAKGPASLAARAEGFVPRGGVPVPDPVDGPVRIALLRGGTLEGEVVDAKDRPIDGASIEVIGTDLSGLPVSETPMLLAFRREHFEWALPGPVPLIPAGELGVMPGPVPPIPGALGALPADDSTGSGASPADEIAPWVTRFDGTFTANPVTPGRVRALVRHPAYVEAISDAVTLGPGGTAHVKIVMLAGGSLEGTVVDDDRRPVAGARVDLTAVQGTLERTTLTADDGTFAFAAVPEEVLLSLARPDDLSRVVLRKTVEVGEGEKKTIEIRLPAPRDPLKVVVHDEDGQPVDAAQVTVLSLDPDNPLRRTFFTAADGELSFEDAKGLSLRIVVDAPGWARTTMTTAEAPDTVEVTLRHGVIVEGHVTVVRGRRFLDGASVTIVADGMRKSAITDAEGAWSIRDVTPGPVRVVVSHPEYATSETTVDVERTGRADRPFEMPPVDLSEPATVEGEVVDDAGKPVLGARVAVGVVPAYLPAGALPPGIAVTDSAGHFKLADIEPGTLTLEAYAADVGRGAVHGVEIASGRPTTGVVIHLARGADDDEPATAGSVAVTLGERGQGASLQIVVVQVASGSEAERAGLRAGDVIERVDGVRPTDMRDARKRLSGPLATDVLVEIERDDTTLKERVQREQVRR